MNARNTPKTMLLSIAVIGGLFALPGASHAAASAAEQSNLELMIRQLESIQRISKQSAALPEAEGARYHFDYERFDKDIELMREGIRDYLTPSRAQPRDPAELTGHYTTSVRK